MGLTSSGIKAVIKLGGTGVPYTTPIGRDIVYTSPWEGGTTEGGVQVDGKTALTYIPFFAGVRLISEDLGSLPWGVFRKRPSGGREEVPEHSLQPVIHDQANPYMSSMTFRETLQAHVLTWGNGYAEIEYATDGSIMNLWPLRPDRTELRIHPTLEVPYYRVELNSGGVANLRWENVFHVHGLGFDGLRGYSVVELARRSLAAAIAAEKYGANVSKGQIPPAILKTQRKYSDGELDNLRESWDAIDHRNRVAILEEGLDFQVIGIPAKDAQWLQSGDQLRSLMATLLRLPPHMLSDVDKSTSWGTGIEQQDIGYTKHTLRPWQVRWDAEAKIRLLRGDTTHYTRMNLNALLAADMAARWAAYTSGRNAGVYSVDDINEMEDRNPIGAAAGGDVRLMPLNMIPLDQWAMATLEQRLELLRALTLAGFQPEAVAEAVDVEPIEHTELEPITVSEQGPYIGNGNGNGTQPPAPGVVPDALRQQR